MATGSDNAAAESGAMDWSTRLYNELRQLAAGQLGRLPPGQTLQATALVHEAWLKLGAGDQCWRHQ